MAYGNGSRVIRTCFLYYQTKKITLPLQGEQIPKNYAVKYLGVHLNKKLTWKTHIEQEKKRAI